MCVHTCCGCYGMIDKMCAINWLLQMDGGSGDFETVFDNRLDGVQVDEQDGELCWQS